MLEGKNTFFKGSLELNWINKDKSLYYEYDEDGNPKKPIWIDKNDIRVSEPRILKLVEEYGDTSNLKDPLDNALIRGDNLLTLKTLVEVFKERDEKNKIKCIYLDPPYNLGTAFENYDDNLEHSEWLSMMRDRLTLLRQLLRDDGAIFIQIDYHELAYLKVVMDEIFGRKNFVQLISVKTASPAGFKTVNPGPIDVTEYILFYTKNKQSFEFKRLYVPILYDSNYSLVIENVLDAPENWKFESIIDIIYRNEKIKDWREAREKWGENWKVIRESFIADYALKNCERVVSIRDPHKPTEKVKELLKISKENPEKVIKVDRENERPLYLFKGGSLAFYQNKIKVVDGKKTATELLTDFWSDISWAGIAKEGGVKFKNSKKPEKLLKRIIDMASEEGNLVLDSFLGSGTTSAVAHKMNRKWIGIEIGKHAETFCLKRLQTVISRDNPDSSGISENDDIHWKGGGGFRYYNLGDSLINDGEINWSFSYKEIAQALFMNFDYSYHDKVSDEIYIGKSGNNYAFCIVSKDLKILNKGSIEDLISNFLESSKIVIYTNNGIAIRAEDLPDNVSIKKIPESILTKYHL
jgi:adenine-specific DNA-methyltransferase